MATLLKPANTELVTMAWIREIPGIEPAAVDTQLPTKDESWALTGFIRVGPVVGGATSMYVPLREPVVEMTFWGANPDTVQPDWETPAALAEIVTEACYQNLHLNTPLILRPGYRRARVTSAWWITEPARDRNDIANYGKFIGHLAINWIEIPE